LSAAAHVLEGLRAGFAQNRAQGQLTTSLGDGAGGDDQARAQFGGAAEGGNSWRWVDTL